MIAIVGHMLDDLPRFFTVRQVAAGVGVHERTVRQHIATGVLGSVKVAGRRYIPEPALRAYLGLPLS